ncbi:MAG: hypothetical protein N0C90_25560 [Candidatus Thiodiazotropha endolucinida]|nr:hypothetical protein [Candidatus Thiodiazotropha taylori]MCW4264716.1 hypothetical protein [Candidatus Thiodiazotropha endolucinida]
MAKLKGDLDLFEKVKKGCLTQNGDARWKQKGSAGIIIPMIVEKERVRALRVKRV